MIPMLIRLTDNTATEPRQDLEHSVLIGKLANKTLTQLEEAGVIIFPPRIRDSLDLDKKQIVIKEENKKYITGNVVGFIGKGNERLTISSRFADGDNDFFFQYLLAQVLDIPNIVDLKTGSEQDDLLDLSILMFPVYLKNALRKGLYKKYVRRDYNDSNVKGIIDIPRQIKQNTPFLGRIAYYRREFSYDNYLTELIRHTIEFIKTKKIGHALLNTAKDEVRMVIDATLSYKLQDRQRVIIANKRNTVRHAYFHEYQELQQLCLMILGHEKRGIGDGAKQIHGILFDCSWLWEEYMNKLIGDIFHHPRNKEKKDKQYLFTAGESMKGEIYPDFISKISKSTDPRIIADAKYKPAQNIGNADYFQVLAYMFRFDSKTGYYLYPEPAKSAENNADETLWLNSGSSFEDNVEKRDDTCVIKHGLRIPQRCGSYEDFCKKISGNAKEFKKTLLGVK